MTALPIVDGIDIHRGLPKRFTNRMELLQFGSIMSIAAAAGCDPSTPYVDDGDDVTLYHYCERSNKKYGLDIQMKATAAKDRWNASHTEITAYLSNERYELYRDPDVTFPRIIVIMDVPVPEDEWINVSEEKILIGKCYWTSIAGFPPKTGCRKVPVKAKVDNVFDDAALCEIMGRIEAGEPLCA